MMHRAVYIAIFLHFARKTIRKISESKEEWARRLVASMEETNVKIYRDIYTDPSKCLVDYKGYSDMPYKVTFAPRHLYTTDDQKHSYEIVKDLVKQKYPSITAKS